jgi:hypothetical protein
MAGSICIGTWWHENYAGRITPECVWSVTYDIQSSNKLDKIQRMIGPRNTNIEPTDKDGCNSCTSFVMGLYNNADSAKSHHPLLEG